MPPYSHSIDGAVQLVAPTAPSNANEKPLRCSSSSSSFSRISETHESRSLARWRQLRRMVHLLTGLRVHDAAVATSSSTATSPGGRRRRAQSLSGSSPILLLHHDFWLEALDDKHRYGFHLRAFHALWMQELSVSVRVDDDPSYDKRNRSFFYWLDSGAGSDVELPHCNRAQLDATRVQYCSEPQRRQFLVEFAFARIAFAACQTPVQTDSLTKWIFVLSQDDKLYVARKRKGVFHHSSFLAGMPIVAAGKIYVSEGTISAIEPHSGHFKPKLSSLIALCTVLEAHGVDVSHVHFIKPKKWKDPWPFEESSDSQQAEEDEGEPECISDSEDS